MSSDVKSAFSGLHVSVVSALAERRGDWDDTIPQRYASAHPFGPGVTDFDWVREFSVEWYNAFWGDVFPSDQTILDILTKAIALACVAVNSTTLVPIWLYTSSAPTWYKFDDISTEELCSEFQVKPTELDPAYLLELERTLGMEEFTKLYKYTEKSEQKAFRAQWLTWMKQLEERNIDALFQVNNLIAFSAAVALRGIVKDNRQISAIYLKENYQRNIYKIARLPEGLIVPAPHKNFTMRVEKYVSKSSSIVKALLAHGLTVFLAENIEHFRGISIEDAKTFVKAAYLTHLEHNGMSVCSLFIRTAKACGSTAPDLASNLNCLSLKSSLIQLGDTFRKYQQSRTWWWARAFDDGYLVDLSWKNHKMLICVLSEMLKNKEPVENVGIMEAQAVNMLNEEDKGRAIHYAHCVLEVCYSASVESENAEINQKYQELIAKDDLRQKETKKLAEERTEEDERKIAKMIDSLKTKRNYTETKYKGTLRLADPPDASHT